MNNQCIVNAVDEPFLQRSGIHHDELVGKTIFDLSTTPYYNKEDRALFLRQACLAEGISFGFSRKPKIPYFCRLFAKPVATQSFDTNNDSGYFCLINEVDHSIMEPRIPVDEDTLFNVIDQIRDPIILSHSQHWTILSFNRAFELFSGWNKADMRGKSFRSFFRNDSAYQEFNRVRSHNLKDSDIYLGRWHFETRNGKSIACAVIHLDCIILSSGELVDAFIFLDRQEEAQKIIKLDRIAKEYRKLIQELGALSLPLDDEDVPEVHMTQVLSKRQNEIVHLAARGYSSKEIAGRLYIAEVTVRNHLSILYRRFKVSSRIELINELRKLDILKNG